MIQEDLVQYLPSDLDEAFRRTLAPGEDVLVSLPGALGEALAVTSRRIAVIREKGPVEGIDVFSYQLPKVESVALGSSTTGGTLVIQTTEPVEDEQRTVYFSSYDKDKFEAAKERIEELLAVAQAARDCAPGAEVSSSACPSCGAAVSDRDAFCSACGARVRDICQMCAGPMPIDAAFCPHCGCEARPATLECRSCRARVNSVVMAYCPQCGTSLSPKCGSCGGALVAGWPRCRYCGREIGAEGIPGRAIHLQRHRQSEEQARVSVPAEEAAEVEEAAETPAARHNARGAELFNEEKFEEAIEEFRRAVTLDPENASYHCNLAVAYGETDQVEDARREYERALELNPKDTTALLYLGYLLNENDEPERAAELWRRLIQIAPGTPEAEEADQNLRAQEAL